MHKYRGDISTSEAWTMLEQQENSFLIDVRTYEELLFTGAPWLREIDKELVHIPLRLLPNMKMNPAFKKEIQETIPELDAKLLFICRSGERSMEAATLVSKLGYSECYNVLGGFEGERDHNDHRGNIRGWKADWLTWRQH